MGIDVTENPAENQLSMLVTYFILMVIFFARVKYIAACFGQENDWFIDICTQTTIIGILKDCHFIFRMNAE